MGSCLCVGPATVASWVQLPRQDLWMGEQDPRLDLRGHRARSSMGPMALETPQLGFRRVRPLQYRVAGTRAKASVLQIKVLDRLSRIDLTRPPRSDMAPCRGLLQSRE